MALLAIVHLVGEDAILADMDELPDPNHNYLVLRNIRKKDGKPPSYVDDQATAFLYSWTRISFIEMMGDVPGTSRAEKVKPAGTTVFGFFREDDK